MKWLKFKDKLLMPKLFSIFMDGWVRWSKCEWCFPSMIKLLLSSFSVPSQYTSQTIQCFWISLLLKGNQLTSAKVIKMTKHIKCVFIQQSQWLREKMILVIKIHMAHNLEQYKLWLLLYQRISCDTNFHSANFQWTPAVEYHSPGVKLITNEAYQ